MQQQKELKKTPGKSSCSIVILEFICLNGQGFIYLAHYAMVHSTKVMLFNIFFSIGCRREANRGLIFQNSDQTFINETLSKTNMIQRKQKIIQINVTVFTLRLQVHLINFTFDLFD